MAALNQHMLLCLAAFRQKAEPVPAHACSCPPTACMCSPASGCEHNHDMASQKRKKQISACHPRQHEAVYSFSWNWEVPTLTHRLVDSSPCLPFAYLDFSPADFALQQYSPLLDKPPQTPA
jgi:hypothetical protein